MDHRQFTLSAVLIAATFGCAGGKPVDIGENNPAKTGERLSDYAASWDGFVEAYNFASGSDRVRVTLDESGNGTLELGEDVDYGTPQAGVAYAPPATLSPGPPVRTLREGYPYTVLAASVEASRLELAVDGFELYGDWCALQTPSLEVPPPMPPMQLHAGGVPAPMDPPGTYVCNDGTLAGDDVRSVKSGSSCALHDADGNEIGDADCTQAVYCAYTGAPCTCTETECSVTEETENFEDRLDGALDDENTFTGTLVFADDSTTGNTRVTVHLVRQ